MLAPEARAGRREPSPGHHLPGLPGDKPSLMSAPGLRTHSPPPPGGACRAHTHWCSIWKLRCPLNQSMKSEGSTLQVAASCQERVGHR